jgi:hypothetical protein
MKRANQSTTPKEGFPGRINAPSHTDPFLSAVNKRCCLEQQHRRGDLPTRWVVVGSQPRMQSNITTSWNIRSGAVLGVLAASSPHPGQLNTKKKTSKLDFFRVSWLSRLKQYPSHARACSRTCTYTRWVAYQVGHLGQQQIQEKNMPVEWLNPVVSCPIPPNRPAGTPGTLAVGWSA